jgi:hypothetical protein
VIRLLRGDGGCNTYNSVRVMPYFAVTVSQVSPVFTLYNLSPAELILCKVAVGLCTYSSRPDRTGRLIGKRRRGAGRRGL